MRREQDACWLMSPGVARPSINKYINCVCLCMVNRITSCVCVGDVGIANLVYCILSFCVIRTPNGYRGDHVQ